jgi:hypothetical protein
MQKGLDDARNGRVTPLDDIYAKLSEAISEIKNGAQLVDAEKIIRNLMISPFQSQRIVHNK